MKPHPTSLLLLLLSCSSAFAQTVWTNTAGRAFTARLEQLTDTHATFVMPDGSTNRLAVAALHPGSQATARHTRRLPVIPDAMQATFAICQGHLRRIAYMQEDQRLDAREYADTRRRLLNGFRGMYVKHGLPEQDYAMLEQRLLESSRITPAE